MSLSRSEKQSLNKIMLTFNIFRILAIKKSDVNQEQILK